MNRIRPDVDVVMDVLKGVLEVRPDSSFVQSLLQQYQERGGLSKKQLQGLYDKASKLNSIPPGKMATLEAIILKKPTRYKSALPTAELLKEEYDQETARLIEQILQKYPQHKRVLFFKSKTDNREALSSAEVSELQKFAKALG